LTCNHTCFCFRGNQGHVRAIVGVSERVRESLYSSDFSGKGGRAGKTEKIKVNYRLKSRLSDKLFSIAIPQKTREQRERKSRLFLYFLNDSHEKVNPTFSLFLIENISYFVNQI